MANLKDKLILITEKLLKIENLSTKNKVGLKIFFRYINSKDSKELKYLSDDLVEHKDDIEKRNVNNLIKVKSRFISTIAKMITSMDPETIEFIWESLEELAL